jgi:hypothetical protein
LAKESPVVREHPVERSLAELGMSDLPWRKPEHVNAQTKKLESIVRMILALKNILFTLVVPGTVGVYLPLILARGRNPATDFSLGSPSYSS